MNVGTYVKVSIALMFILVNSVGIVIIHHLFIDVETVLDAMLDTNLSIV